MRGWWTLKIENTEDERPAKTTDMDLEHIAELIKQGCTSGEVLNDEWRKS